MSDSTNSQPIDSSLLAILRCPATASTLHQASDSLVQSINRRIAEGNLYSRIMEPLDAPLDGGLVNLDQSLLFPVYQGIPDMNPDDAIELSQLEKETTDD